MHYAYKIACKISSVACTLNGSLIERKIFTQLSYHVMYKLLKKSYMLSNAYLIVCKLLSCYCIHFLGIDMYLVHIIDMIKMRVMIDKIWR